MVFDSQEVLSKFTDIPFLYFMQCINENEDSKILVDKPMKISANQLKKNFKKFFFKIVEKLIKLKVIKHKRADEIYRVCADNKSSFVTYLIMKEIAEMLKTTESIDNCWITNKIKSFMNSNFEKKEEDFEHVKIVEKDINIGKHFEIKKIPLKNMAAEIYEKWNLLHVENSTAIQSSHSSLITLKHPFTIPGGRFNEIYYWDSLWIVDGQLACGMRKTALECIRNFRYLILEFGFIPNGTRLYYLNRSQPPVFMKMVQKYMKCLSKEEQVQFLKNENIEKAIETEYHFWETEKTIEVEFNNKKFRLSRFSVDTDYPRPESLKQDIETYKNWIKLEHNEKWKEIESNVKEFLYKDNNGIKIVQVPEEYEIYGHLKAAAESGWDFSSRWFSNYSALETICTKNIIPVELNAFLYEYEIYASQIMKKLGKIKRGEYFELQAKARVLAINTVLWSEDCWYDYNISTKKHSKKHFYFSNIHPLFVNILPPQHTIYHVLAKYQESLFGHKGGVPCSSNYDCKQQWDAPNVWAPHQELIVSYLLEIQEKEMAFHAAKSFYMAVRGNVSEKFDFYEKYNCDAIGSPGGEGEYVVQLGFGWTNGVIIRFIKEFKDALEQGKKSHSESFSEIKTYLEDKIASESIELSEIKVKESRQK